MMRSLEIGATGMLAQQLNVDVISNNIANMTTTGYKRVALARQFESPPGGRIARPSSGRT